MLLLSFHNWDYLENGMCDHFQPFPSTDLNSLAQDSRSEDTPLSESTRTELCFPGSDAQRLLWIDELLENQHLPIQVDFSLTFLDYAMPYALCELLMREAEVYRIAFEKEKELTDRALKLAEVGKPKSNWKVQRVLGAWPLSLLDPWVSYPYRIFRVPERKFETARSALS